MGRIVTQIPNHEPERLKRVLDAKWRTIGVDVNALAGQVVDRMAAEQAEKERDAAFAQMSQYYSDQLTIQQQEADLLRATYNRDVQDFRTTGQLQDTRREWDLNRPDAKLIDAPARIGDEDVRNGASSLQKFEGEDLTAADRKGAQMDQAREWWAEQTAIKDALAAAANDAEAAHAELVRFQDALQLAAKSEEASLRREVAVATAEYNKRLAEEKRLRLLAEKQADAHASMAEMEAHATSAFMTEDPSMAASALSGTRVRKDHYKGMTEAEKAAVLDAQLAQMEEKKARKAAAALEESMYARSQHDIQRALNEQARRVDEFKKTQAERAQGILRKQADEKVARDAGINALYKNAIAPEFFTQFGTSHR